MPRRGKPPVRLLPGSDGVESQVWDPALAGSQGRLLRRMASAIVTSLCAAAANATSLALPAATGRLENALRAGLCRTADNAAMDGVVRTAARPPTIVRRPRSVPLSRSIDARPTSAAILRRPKVPGSGSPPSSVREATGPMPGMPRNSSSRSRQAGQSRTASASRRSLSSTCRLS